MAAVPQAPAPGRASPSPRPDLDLAGWWAAERHSPAAPLRAEEGQPAEASGPGPAPPAWPSHPSKRGWRAVAHLWALAKMGLTTWTVEWALGYVHAHLAEDLCVYGLMCLFAGAAARWFKRFFGPAQVLEPELYGEIGRWLYRAGVVLVLAGGVVDVLGQL